MPTSVAIMSTTVSIKLPYHAAQCHPYHVAQCHSYHVAQCHRIPVGLPKFSPFKFFPRTVQTVTCNISYTMGYSNLQY